MRSKRVLGLVSALVGVAALLLPTTAASAEEDAPKAGDKVMLKGSTTASYFWDDGSGRNGDTGMPASGEPMQKGLAASPSWPLMTEGYVIYEGKKMPFFVGDRGPGDPSSEGIMLDLDAKTFAELTGGEFNDSTLAIDGNGGAGHIEVKYVITKWGDGPGKKNDPVPFDTGWYDRYDESPAQPVTLPGGKAAKAQAQRAADQQASKQAEEDAEKQAAKDAENDDQQAAPGGQESTGGNSSGGDQNSADTNGGEATTDDATLANQESESGGPAWVFGIAVLLIAGGLGGLFSWFRRQGDTNEEA